MSNGTFVIGIRSSSAYAEIIFAADSILELPLIATVESDDLVAAPGGGTGCKNLDILLDTA